jgi:quinol-cytochrome oxidoreductase complex cytochrome b subunit
VAVLVRAQRRTPTEKALGWMLAAAAAELAVLAVTGVFLIFFYRPSWANAWSDVRGVSRAVTFGQVVRAVHRVTSEVMVVTLLVIAVVGVILAISRSTRSRPHKATVAAVGGVTVVGLFASFTGFLLPWDQLALWSVTVGTNLRGFLPIIRNHSQVQFVLIGHATISVDTLRRWFFIHVALLPAAVVSLGTFAAWRLFRRRDEPDRHTGLGS